MSQLSLTLAAALDSWCCCGLLVLDGSIGVLRADLYGTRVTARGRGRNARTAARRTRVRRRPPPPGAPRASRRARFPPTRRRRSFASSPRVRSRARAFRSAPRPCSIGRAPTCTLVIDDDYCSARHCRIFPEGGEWFVEDLGSTNGTYLGNQKITDPVAVAPRRPGPHRRDHPGAAARDVPQRLHFAARIRHRAGARPTTRTPATPVRTCWSSRTAWAAPPAATSPRRSRWAGSRRSTTRRSAPDEALDELKAADRRRRTRSSSAARATTPN